MRPNYKINSLLKLADAFLNFMRDPSSKDFDHLIPQLSDAIKRVNQIISFYPKAGLNDNFIVQFPVCVQLHQLLLQIIDVCEMAKLNFMKPFVLLFALTPDGELTQWNNAGTLLYNVLNAKKTIDITADQLLSSKG